MTILLKQTHDDERKKQVVYSLSSLLYIVFIKIIGNGVSALSCWPHVINNILDEKQPPRIYIHFLAFFANMASGTPL